MKTLFLRFVVCAAVLVPVTLALGAEDKEKKDKTPEVYPAAVLPFQERGKDAKDLGAKVTDLLFAKLAADPGLMLVDREDLKKQLEEQELNLSGLVNPQQANKVGQLTGAKLLITGSVLQVDNSMYLVAKIIGTETSRVVGASVKGNVRDDLGTLVEDLSKEISKSVTERGGELVAKPVSREDPSATRLVRMEFEWERGQVAEVA
jgi:TolB-like protein